MTAAILEISHINAQCALYLCPFGNFLVLGTEILDTLFNTNLLKQFRESLCPVSRKHSGAYDSESIPS